MCRRPIPSPRFGCFASGPNHPPADGVPPLVPRAFLTLAEGVACHRDEARWPLLYQALWRLNNGERALLGQGSGPLVPRLQRLATAGEDDPPPMTALGRLCPPRGGARGDLPARGCARAPGRAP